MPPAEVASVGDTPLAAANAFACDRRSLSRCRIVRRGRAQLGRQRVNLGTGLERFNAKISEACSDRGCCRDQPGRGKQERAQLLCSRAKGRCEADAGRLRDVGKLMALLYQGRHNRLAGQDS